ncbi:MaoC family dehydratase [Hydrogenophaga sp. BPS33]|uniref:MaoC family dehydratase n=1 Tax=Hydrogenophaga sp. BPS33 TaxID=2651974 RepID=UPI00131F5440|nr:MaoC family dehydratase [Hydrogenophaga sp. BPS33]QHE87868.1 MaoC family dehydratase [Hydrogenophaga sp. BPS33]
MAGMYYEEFQVGMNFQHALTRTVTEMDNIMFCAMTHNPQPLHLDEEFAKQTDYGQRIVNSLFTLGLVIGVTVCDTTLGTTLGNLGMTDIRFQHPLFHGDTVRVETHIKAMRESQSRPTAGLVTFEHTGFNQRGQEICYCVRTGLMRKRPA